MIEGYKYWFVISFCQLDLSSKKDIRNFLIYWYQNEPVLLKKMVAYALEEEFSNFKHLNALGIYKMKHGELDEDGTEFSPKSQSYSDGYLSIDLSAITNSNDKFFNLQATFNSYLKQLNWSFIESLKYDYETQRMLAQKVDELCEQLNGNSQGEWIGKYMEKYPEYFSTPSNYVSFYRNNSTFTVPKAFGKLTDEINQRLRNINFQISKLPTLAPDGIFYFTIEPELETFEDELYFQLLELHKEKRQPIICAACGKFIENPTEHQIAQVKRGNAVLHKPTDPEKLKKRKKDLDRNRDYWSDCEIKHANKKDKEYYYKRKKAKQTKDNETQKRS